MITIGIDLAVEPKNTYLRIRSAKGSASFGDFWSTN